MGSSGGSPPPPVAEFGRLLSRPAMVRYVSLAAISTFLVNEYVNLAKKKNNVLKTEYMILGPNSFAAVK